MRKIAVLAAAAAALLAGACASFPDALNVRTEPRFYSPAMSSTIGIGLTPVFAAPGGEAFTYRWSASFGYFAALAASGKIAPLGPETESGDGTVYWTYDPRLTADRKPTVTIAVEAVERREDGRVLARKTIKLDWDRDTASVRD